MPMIPPELDKELAGARHVLDLAAGLLQFSRQSASSLREHMRPRGRGRGWRKRIRRALLDRLAMTDVSRVGAGLLSAVRERFEHAEDIPTSVIAYSIAYTLGECFGHTFLGEYLARRSFDTEPLIAKEGDVLPVPHLSVEAWRGISKKRRKLGLRDWYRPTDAGDLNQSYDHIPWLRFVPKIPSGWTLLLDARFANELDEIRGPECHLDVRVGTALLNHDSTKGVELDWDVFSREEVWYFFNVRPTPKARQIERIDQILQEARVGVVDFLVFPELCVSPSDQDALVSRFRKSPQGPTLLVAGSSHVEENETRRNRAVTVFNGRDEHVEHHKFNPFSYHASPDGFDDVEEHLEDVESERVLHVCLSKTWFMTTLICKDCFDDEEIGPLLKNMGVNLLLVPAMSDNMDAFEDDLSKLVLRNHALVVVANNPVTRMGSKKVRDGHAIVMSPFRNYPRRYVHDPAVATVPRLLRFDPFAPFSA